MRNSQYLTTLGKELNPKIHVMWTGNKVIPEIITKESIEELSDVIKRKPVIWDNIHANDYDQRRVFLGAYCGRPTELYPLLAGILTNPNCEFEANFIPIHTLGTWCRVASNIYPLKSSVSGVHNNALNDVAMDDLTDDDACPESPDCIMPLDSSPSTPVDIGNATSHYSPAMALELAIKDWLEEFKLCKQAPIKSYAKRNVVSQVVNGQTVLTAKSYNLDTPNTPHGTTMELMRHDKKCVMELSEDSLYLLSDLFCLPYGHGDKGVQLLDEFAWLLSNVRDVYAKEPSKEKVSCWYDRLLKIESHCQSIYDLFVSFCKIPNEAILYDLYPYLWDLKEMVLSLDTYVHWLGNANKSSMSVDQRFICDYIPVTEMIPANDYIESWHAMYLGGLTVALYKLLPFRGGFLFLEQAPDKPTNNLIQTRVFSDNDKEALYQFCAFEDTEELIDIERIDLPGDRDIGPYINVSPKTVFTVEDNKGICGFVTSIANNCEFHESYTQKWLPEMSKKYNDDNLGSLLSAVGSNENWLAETSAHFNIRLNSRAKNALVMKRVLSSVMSALKVSGSTNVFCQLTTDMDVQSFTNLGFCPACPENPLLMWRPL